MALGVSGGPKGKGDQVSLGEGGTCNWAEKFLHEARVFEVLLLMLCFVLEKEAAVEYSWLPSSLENTVARSSTLGSSTSTRFTWLNYGAGLTTSSGRVPTHSSMIRFFRL